MTVSMEKPYVLGMDIGGTNTVFGVVDSRGNVLASDSVKTQQYDDVNEYVDAVCKKLHSDGSASLAVLKRLKVWV